MFSFDHWFKIYAKWTQGRSLYNKRFELNFQSCIVKNSYKISLVLDLPKCTMVVPEGQKMSKFCMI